ncbi:hypothetical protein GCK72_002731 [Caenorhabditis remanei]|uniref:Uncharacterized protein n=1 Tax=Caenorhabditis remanei TaxID=31234 RepID=A0A6A5HWX6_CAERE|nr:hypothetical protein GCK72_002731 [Caenorhabditis remanei]KAF1770907.1 hypothetical protein GCK72_002731 [Caenorhabditis remanei]
MQLHQNREWVPLVHARKKKTYRFKFKKLLLKINEVGAESIAKSNFFFSSGAAAAASPSAGAAVASAAATPSSATFGASSAATGAAGVSTGGSEVGTSGAFSSATISSTFLISSDIIDVFVVVG